MPFVPYSQTVQRVAEALRTTFDAIDPWFDRPAAARSHKPANGGWSIDEILEHISLTSHFLLIVIRNSTRKALRRAETRGPVSDGESDLDLLEPIGQRGAFAWSRPEHMIPTGTVPAAQVRQTLRDQAEECLALLDQLQAGEGSLHKVRMSVNQSGRLDIYQWLYFLAQHARRHISQMEAVEAEWETSSASDPYRR
ncbi:MAG TPA: DinB family protein [Thermoanaerobaculia bacterium]|nr:DinB family protein [Thermoanaerobaculia bacterium]